MPDVNNNINNSTINVRLTYPYSDKFEYKTILSRINIDQERINDLRNGRGFAIISNNNIKLDLKNQSGIFSNKFGSTIADVDSFNGKYRCRCGYTKGSIMHGETCPLCGHIVKFYDDDISIFGWLIMKNKYFIIHPNIYRSLEGFIGVKRLAHIIEPDVQIDSDGKIIAIGNPNAKKNEPFKGIGMFNFRERYQEILDYYLNKYPTKKSFYDDLVANKDITFINSIPVFSSLLRPSVLENGSILRYQETNKWLQMLARLVAEVNRDELHMDNKIKEKLILLNDIQLNYNEVYNELRKILSSKKGDIRSAIGGRYVFSSRSVITQDPYLKVNEVRLPFAALVELYQQVIINILCKTHTISYSEAYKIWYRALIKNEDETVYKILQSLIQDQGGIPLLINRNPTINYGGILRVNCIGINKAYTMSISLLILPLLGADFDGDTLNILALFNKDFSNITNEIFNPTQMYISRNDGLCNRDLLPARDILINANAFKSCGRYSQEEIDQINECMSHS